MPRHAPNLLRTKLTKSNQSHRDPQYDAGAGALHLTVLGHDFTHVGEAESCQVHINTLHHHHSLHPTVNNIIFNIEAYTKSTELISIKMTMSPTPSITKQPILSP